MREFRREDFENIEKLDGLVRKLNQITGNLEQAMSNVEVATRKAGEISGNLASMQMLVMQRVFEQFQGVLAVFRDTQDIVKSDEGVEEEDGWA